MDNKAKILDIAMNLTRIGNWAADDYKVKRKRIELFLDETTEYINSIDRSSLLGPFKKTFENFLAEYSRLEKIGKEGPKDQLYWAEQMMTWGNILTHRSRLI
jgi:hypothetical protein